MRDALQVTLRVLTVATQKVFMANTFGDGYYVKGMTCHPERSEGTQGGVSFQPSHHLLANARSLSPPPKDGAGPKDGVNSERVRERC